MIKNLKNYDAQAAQQFPFRASSSFISRINLDDPKDPLLKQILPTSEELKMERGYSKDPLKEKEVNVVPGLLHKYQGRVLLIVTQACPIHCRYCFRRHFPYEDNVAVENNWQAAIDYIQKDSTISEVILSGGDPLMVKEDKLKTLIQQLNHIPHLKRLRIHTRTPIAIPQQITHAFVGMLVEGRLKPVVVIHCNHAQEINEEVRQALKKFTDAKIPLLNQSVLLKGVNDNVEVLSTLSETLFENGVIPYYLHFLDPVEGAQHFEVSKKKALQLVKALRHQLPGYLVPALVQEIAGEKSKTLL